MIELQDLGCPILSISLSLSLYITYSRTRRWRKFQKVKNIYIIFRRTCAYRNCVWHVSTLRTLKNPFFQHVRIAKLQKKEIIQKEAGLADGDRHSRRSSNLCSCLNQTSQLFFRTSECSLQRHVKQQNTSETKDYLALSRRRPQRHATTVAGFCSKLL